MPRTLILIFALSLITGCTYVGSKSALDVDSGSKWKLQYGEYSFHSNAVILSIPEIVIKKHAAATGPILPIFPLNHDTSFKSKQLELRLTVTGFPSVASIGPDAIVISAYSAGNLIPLLSKSASVVSKTTKNNNDGKLWVQYSLRYIYDTRLGNLYRLSLQFQLPMFDGKVPELHLTRREESDNQFIISPGT